MNGEPNTVSRSRGEPKEDPPVNTAFWDFSYGATEHMMLGALLAAGLDRDGWAAAMTATFPWQWQLDIAPDDASRRTMAVRVRGEGKALALNELRNVSPTQASSPAVVEFTRTLELLGRMDPEATVEVADAVAMAGVHVGAHLLGLRYQWRTPVAASPAQIPCLASVLSGEDVTIRVDRAVEVSRIGVALARTLASVPALPVTLRLDTAGIGIGAGVGSGGTTGERASHVVVTLGSAAQETERVFEAQTTVDDMDPELLPPLLESLREGGALDAWWSPAVTKGGRPGVTVHLLCQADLLDRLSTRLFRESTTIGLRFHEVHRRVLQRTQRTVNIEAGAIRIKETALPDGGVRWKAELGDCLRAARESGLTVNQVRGLVRRAVEAGSTW